MKKQIFILCISVLTVKTSFAQWATWPAAGGNIQQNLSAYASIKDHLIFNSQNSVIEWGDNGVGDMYFRTLSGQGNIWSYTDRIRIKNNGWINIGGNVGNNAVNPSDQVHVFPSAGANGITITQNNTGASALTLHNGTSGGRSFSLRSTGNGDPLGSGNFLLYDNANFLTRFFVNGQTGNTIIGGGPNASTPTTKLHVFHDVNTTSVFYIGGLFEERFTNSGTGTQTGLEGKVTSPVNYSGGNAAAIGVTGRAYLASGIFNIGVNAETNGATLRTIGVQAIGKSANPTVGETCWTDGVYAYAETVNGTAYGIESEATALGTGIPLAGMFWGNVQINGDCNRTGSDNFTSDQKLKNDIKPLSNMLDKIKMLKPSTYTFKKDKEFADMKLPEGKQMGLIAQELEKVFPELVSEMPALVKTKGKDGDVATTPNYKGVKYVNLIPVLVAGIQEQQQQIEKQSESIINQQKQIEELKTLLQSLANNTEGTKNNHSTAINLSDKNAIVLNQNVPNPFAESTVITYNVPTDFNKAQIIFITNDGKVIKSIDISVKGEGRLNVFANDLSSGMYSYSLIVDGKTIDTKKMIKE
ncbi:MAG: tail fiber domain-containing protein [Bacteroidia bacterium]|nr:tail fiber domain-containing protein [Bacteroidia bacterium]